MSVMSFIVVWHVLHSYIGRCSCSKIIVVLRIVGIMRRGRSGSTYSVPLVGIILCKRTIHLKMITVLRLIMLICLLTVQLLLSVICRGMVLLVMIKRSQGRIALQRMRQNFYFSASIHTVTVTITILLSTMIVVFHKMVRIISSGVYDGRRPYNLNVAGRWRWCWWFLGYLLRGLDSSLIDERLRYHFRCMQ